jgi:hypothetical protein
MQRFRNFWKKMKLNQPKTLESYGLFIEINEDLGFGWDNFHKIFQTRSGFVKYNWKTADFVLVKQQSVFYVWTMTSACNTREQGSSRIGTAAYSDWLIQLTSDLTLVHMLPTGLALKAA